MQEIPQPDPSIFKPKGTDTVPAMLTPGENVVNAEASRIYQPMLDKMNDHGRAIQKQQGGPIPTYAANGVTVDDSMLDAIKQVESGGDPNALSGVGAGGQYQIMPKTALNPGYGVTPISLEERFDPATSRTFAKQYLQGIIKQHPEFTKDQVLTAYHSGVGNVLKNNLGPEGQAYAGKVNSEIEDTQVAMYDGQELTYPNTQNYGASKEKNPREIQRSELGVSDDIIIDSGGSVQPVNPNRIAKDIPTKLAEQFAKDGNKERYDRRLGEYNQALKQHEAHKKFVADKKLNIDLESNAKINKEITTIDAQIEEAKKNNDDTLVQVLIKKKEKLNKDIVTTDPEEDKKNRDS